MRSTRVTEAAAPAAVEASPTLVQRVFSLAGLVPLGAFLVLHLVVNARALRGEPAFEAATDATHAVPGFRLLVALLVYVPLVLHSILGLWLWLGTSVEARAAAVAASPYPPAVASMLRFTGVLTLAFLLLHLTEMRAFSPGSRPPGGVLLTLLSANLSSTWRGVPLRGLAYLAGTFAVTVHFAAGLWGVLARTPRGRAPAMRRWLAWAAGTLGAVVFLLFVDVVVLHATGSRLLGRAAPPAVDAEPCPPPEARPAASADSAR